MSDQDSYDKFNPKYAANPYQVGHLESRIRFIETKRSTSWIISIVSSILTTIATIGVVFYFMGQINSKVESQGQDIEIIKNEIFSLSRGTRSPSDDQWKLTIPQQKDPSYAGPIRHR